MALFYKRPLACACACFMLAVFLSYFAPITLCFILVCALLVPALALLGVCLFRHFSYRKLFLLLVLLALLLGLARTACDRLGVQEARESVGEEAVAAELVITDVLYQNAYGAEFLASTESISEEELTENVVVRFSFAAPFGVGDRIRGEFLLRDLDFEAYSQDAEYRYFSEGAKLLLVAENTPALALLESGTNTLSAKLSRLRAIAAFRIADTVGGEEGKLLAAMLLGTKDALSDATVRDFRLSGVSHLLALSGLHLMILVGVIERFLCLVRVPKRVRIAVMLPLCLFYLLLTGCNFSLLRAMLMLGAVYLSFLLREDNDSLTALFVSAALILAVTPFAVFSLSFQMTMLATLGILSFSKFHTMLCRVLPAQRGLWGVPLGALRVMLSSLLITISTTLCLLPVLWLTVGSYSLITPLANLVLVPLAPLLLISAVVCLVLPFSVCGSIAAFAARIALLLTRFFASFDLMLSLTRDYVPYVLIPVLCLGALLLLFDLKRRCWIALTPLAVAVAAFAVAIPIANHVGKAQLQVTYRGAGKNEGLILVQNESAVLCDLSASTLTQWRANWYAAQDMGATQVEALMLTHYHSKSVSALSRFAKIVYLHALWLPEPQTKEESDIFLQLTQ
ncbi:MAG: ComEC/Rec2 family competence protein, partial [Clostridia bacterium]|nr:ComEC/Rec2 family competence protein [Clostridia bacterium]